MKNIFLLINYLLVFSTVSFSQNTIFLKQPEENAQCETAEERQAWKSEVRLLKQAYYASRKDSVMSQLPAAGHVLFGWPMRASSEYDFMNNYFTLGNYVDQDEPGSGVEDYKCGSRTYDGHDAQDINLWPFWWRMMDRNHVMAVAAAPGIILPGRDFNYYDSNCTKVGNPNNITILHDDGTTTRYLHLKKNSLTTKPDNSRVEQGEFLGFIGSSGHSSFPHLHFAVYDSLDNLIEPFFEAGTPQCNVFNPDSWWQNQRPYWDPQINRLMTHSAQPSLEWCPQDEVVNAKNQFNSGDIMYTGIAFMDGQDNDVATCTLTQPNGIVYSTWNVTLTYTDSRIYAANYHLLPSGNTGTWVFKATYRGRVYAHFFTVGCKDNETPSGSISGNSGFITGNFISSTVVHDGSSNTKVLYQAANYIELKPGFQAKAGIHFKARIKPCTYTE
jgi:hypothetical protein